MTHHADPDFWRLFANLPREVQDLARENFDLLKRDPRHPSLRFKKLGEHRSVRIGRNYRAVGVDVEDGILWFWIGTHPEYDRLFGG